MRGTLVFNGERPDIAYQDGTTRGGLHCGDRIVIQASTGDEKILRLEYDNDWYCMYAGAAISIPYGCIVLNQLGRYDRGRSGEF